MSTRSGTLIAVDGVNGAAVVATARKVLNRSGRRRGAGLSRWDASGLFEQLVVAEREAGGASARTLLLLYAADLAFRLRWEIEPALAEGQTVVAAPYVDTAFAFGRAVGLRGGWLKNLFQFALPPAERREVTTAAARSSGKGFVEFGCAHVASRHLGLSRQQLAARTRTRLSEVAPRRSGG